MDEVAKSDVFLEKFINSRGTKEVCRIFVEKLFIFYIHQSADRNELIKFLNIFIEERDAAERPVDAGAVKGFFIRTVNANGPANPGIVIP
jgi:hypothetical protein